MDEKIIKELAAALMLRDIDGLAEDFAKIEKAIAEVAGSSLADIEGFSAEPQIMVSASPEEDIQIYDGFTVRLRSDDADTHNGREYLEGFKRAEGEYNSVPRVI